jgi:phage tail sheath protein FI
MPEYLSSGIYIDEIKPGLRLIEGVPTSIAAFLGETERGPLKPRLVTSYKEYERWFGGTFGETKFLPCAVSGFFENGGQLLYVCRLVGMRATPAEAAFGGFVVRAVGSGSWARRVWARIDDSTTQAPGAGGNPQPVGFRLRLAYWQDTSPDFRAFDPFADAATLPRPTLVEDYDDLVSDATSPDFHETRLLDGSALAKLLRTAGVPADARPANGTQALAQNGADDPNPLTVADYEGALVPDARRSELQGLAALELDPYREVALVYAPAVAVETATAIITHCERLRFRFAVIDCDQGMSDWSALDPRTKIQNTQYAAFYYPWIVIADPQNGARRKVPPGGHVLGVYARTDGERGVFKAPANETLRGALELEFDISRLTQDVLNPRGVNVIRQFTGGGIRVWGARTMTSDAMYKYVNVRRLFIFLERSIYEGMQWVVFEPNGKPLWAQVTDAIRLFLRGLWRLGALLGSTADQAYFVKCDETTMTQDDIDNGRLICEVGVAPVRPAEFVVFRISQPTANAQR